VKFRRKRRAELIKKEKSIYTTAIILAAGIGSRFGSGVPKQRISLLGKSIIARAAESFYRCDDIDSIVVVTREEDIDFVNSELLFLGKKLHRVIAGGTCRAESAKLGFLAVPVETTHVAIHDAARCLITPEDISRVAKAAYISGAASAVSIIVDTVKNINDGHILGTVPRDKMVLAETPQIFSFDVYKSALIGASDIALVTDDNMLVENIGHKITAVVLENENPKITYPKDLDYAEFILERRRKKCSD
jgi:2-C-methyl-D-erythritol 4-phosphate cytidylyltransferase